MVTELFSLNDDIDLWKYYMVTLIPQKEKVHGEPDALTDKEMHGYCSLL